jgi:hypothetical protein
MLAKLGDEVRWIHWVGSWSSQLAGILKGSPYTSSAVDAFRSSLNAVRIPRRTREALLSSVGLCGT